MKFKSILAVGAAAALGLSLAACSDTSSIEATDAPAEPSAYELELNATIAACHVAINATDDWRDLDNGAMYDLAKDVIRDNPDAISADGGGLNPRNLAATHCARNMSLYANGGDTPAGLEAAAEEAAE